MRFDTEIEVRLGAGEGFATAAVWRGLRTRVPFVVFDIHSIIRPPLVLAAMICGPGWACCSFSAPTTAACAVIAIGPAIAATSPSGSP